MPSEIIALYILYFISEYFNNIQHHGVIQPYEL